MSKVIIVYGSTSGNTQMVSERMSGLFSESGHEVEVKNAIDTMPSDIDGFDVILFGSSTWNDGDLQDDFVTLHMQFEENKPDLTGKKAAAFGTGETVYEHFCGAVDILEKSLSSYGAEIAAPGLKLDGYPEEEDNVKMIEEWVKLILSKM